MHPNHGHATRAAQAPERAGAPARGRAPLRRARGCPAALSRGACRTRNANRRRRAPRPRAGAGRRDRDRPRHAHETPGHAPSHVALHEPHTGLLISGDHLLGRIALYFDYGHTPDPVREFLWSLDVVERLDAKLCVAGHGSPFRDVQAHIDGNRHEVEVQIGRVREALARGPQTPFELVRALLELSRDQELTPMMVSLGLNMVLAAPARGPRRGGPDRWRRRVRVVGARHERGEPLEVRPRPGQAPGPRAARPAARRGLPASPATC